MHQQRGAVFQSLKAIHHRNVAGECVTEIHQSHKKSKKARGGACAVYHISRCDAHNKDTIATDCHTTDRCQNCHPLRQRNDWRLSLAQISPPNRHTRLHASSIPRSDRRGHCRRHQRTSTSRHVCDSSVIYCLDTFVSLSRWCRTGLRRRLRQLRRPRNQYRQVDGVRWRNCFGLVVTVTRG